MQTLQTQQEEQEKVLEYIFGTPALKLPLHVPTSDTSFKVQT